MRKLTKEESKLYRKYHTSGCGNLTSIKVNAIFINKNIKKGYTKEHESFKFELAWEASGNGEKYLIEAARMATDEEREIFKVKKDKIVDFVNLSQEQEYEIIHKHETDQQIQFYRKKGTIPMVVGEDITCKICNQKYPRRSKKNICQVCASHLKVEWSDT